MIDLAYSHTIEVFHLSGQSLSNSHLATHRCNLDKQNQPIHSPLEAKKNYQYFNCQWLATQYELQYLPAIVIDKQFITYGVTDISEALQLLEKSHA